MKTMYNLRFILLTFLFIAALSSCKKNYNNDDNVGSGKVTVTIDGTNYTLNDIIASSALGLITLTAKDDDVTLSCIMSDDISEGSYDFGDEDGQVSFYVSIGDNMYFPTEGTFKVTKHSGNTIKATFNAKVSNFSSNTLEIPMVI